MATTYAVPFYCHTCGGTQITVSDKQQMKRVHGKNRLHAGVRCNTPECRREWWSRHPTALAMSRVADASAEGWEDDG